MSIIPKPVWPNNARCAVFISFDLDAESSWIARDPSNIRRPGTLSQGTFGAKIGVPRILELLEEEGLQSTFFIPGWVADHRAQRVEMIAKAGHEIGHHGYLHKWIDPDDHAGEEEELYKGLESLMRVTGQRPVGYRAPSGETSPRLIELLLDNGFLYDSSMLDAINPYRHYVEGRKNPLVELPWHWGLDDVPYLVTSIKFHRPIFTNDHIFSIWKEEFDAIYAEGGLFTLINHPQAIGRPSRLAMLRKLIRYMRGFDGVWFATGRQIAEAWNAANPPWPDETSITPFLKI